jgi:hypothetical protein
MKTFYSILYCPIRPVVDERLSIALLVKAENQVFFRYSQDKLKILKELLPLPAYRLLKTSLKSLSDFFNSPEALSKDLFGSNSRSERPFLNVEYFNYLNRYSNNLIHYSTPKGIDLSMNEEVFDNLYFKLIFEADAIQEKKKLIVDRVHSKVNPKIKGHVNLDIELNSSQISNLVVPTPVWFIGKNEKEITGEVIDFNKPTHHLENDIREYLYLLQSLKESKANKQYGQHFLVGNEPAKSNTVNHSIWNEVHQLSYVSYLSVKETDAIHTYVKEHNVTPFLVTDGEVEN